MTSIPTLHPLTAGRALVLGTVVVGVVDLLDAFVFHGMRGVPAVTILHGIASGVLGRSAYGGGAATAALGALLHFFIAFCVVAVYLLASRRWPVLRRNPLLCGPLYGMLVYGVMTLVVLPYSAAAMAPPTAFPVLANGILIHMRGVGLPAAIAAWAMEPVRAEPASPRVAV